MGKALTAPDTTQKTDAEIEAEIDEINGTVDVVDEPPPDPPKRKRDRKRKKPSVDVDAPADAPADAPPRISVDPHALALMLAGMADGMYQGICSIRNYPRVIEPMPAARETFVMALEGYLKTKGGDLPPGVAVVMTGFVCFALPLLQSEMEKRQAKSAA